MFQLSFMLKHQQNHDVVKNTMHNWIMNNVSNKNNMSSTSST